MTTSATTPPAPATAQRVHDFSELGQARSNEVRLALAELERRFPSGAQAELQLWTLPAPAASSAVWPVTVRAHYAAQTVWVAVPDQHIDAGPVMPETQIYRSQSGQQRLAVLLFTGQRDSPGDPALLVVQRAAL